MHASDQAETTLPVRSMFFVRWQLAGAPVLRRVSRRRPSTRRIRSAFTLIELILVIAIMGILATVMVPMFVGAMQEHRLRSATRTIISAGRHAMSLAVISQREILLEFDLEAGSVAVRAAPRYQPAAPDAAAQEGESDGAEDEWEPDLSAGTGEGSENERPEAEQALLEEELVRKLDGVHIESVELAMLGEAGPQGGTIAVRYFTNGRCMPYRVTLYDDDGARTVIDVDALSSAQVEKQ